MKKKVVVNATALRTSGALTVLLQFISEIPKDNNTYYVFIHKSVVISESKTNLVVIHTDKTSFIERFIWDVFGLSNWLKKNGVAPDVAVSLQNTNFRVLSTCPNFVYYHQSIPFYNYKWNVFNKSERNLWFYKNIYPFFVKLLINNNTQFFVQLNYIKDHFSKRFQINKERIHVVFPQVNLNHIENKSNSLGLNSKNLKLFYPATCESYKNHKLLFEVLKTIDNRISRKVDLYLTNNANDFDYNFQFQNVSVNYIGRIPFPDIQWMYNNVDCLVFPSYMETLGLPLIEAASCGLKIFVSDLPYAREVLSGYDGAYFARHNSIEEWSDLLLKESMVSETEKYDKLVVSGKNSWSHFFKIINVD